MKCHLNYLFVFFAAVFMLGCGSANPTTHSKDSPETAVHKSDLAEIRFVCKDSNLRPIWLDLLKEPKFSEQLLRSELRSEYDCSSMLSVSEVDLNQDGMPEKLVRVTEMTVCSATGNCPFAVYTTNNDETGRLNTSSGVLDFSLKRLLFNGGIINTEILDAKSHLFNDILLRFNGSPYENYLEVHKFNGKVYQRNECFDEARDTTRSRSKCWDD